MKMERMNNRKPDELRPVTMKVGILGRADGSAMVRLGNTVAIAAVYGPRELHPKHLQDNTKAILQCNYAMAPFSTIERARPGPSRRSIEISKVTREALEPALFLEEFPRAVIDVYIIVTQANAGTRTAGINAASLALADAGVPMRGLVTAVAAGKIGDEFVLDLEGEEEEQSSCDLPIAYMPNEKKFTLLQMDGDLPKEDVEKVIKLAVKGCEILYEKQRAALREKWIKEEI
jgi:exosome complex component RRP41